MIEVIRFIQDGVTLKPPSGFRVAILIAKK